MDSRFVRYDWHHSLGHFIEEAGECLAAAGKIARWGLPSYNPDLPREQRETNAEWLWRELRDLELSIGRLRSALLHESDACGIHLLQPRKSLNETLTVPERGQK